MRRLLITLSLLLIPTLAAFIAILMWRSRPLPPVNYPAQYTQLIAPPTTDGENAWLPFATATTLWQSATNPRAPHEGADFTVYAPHGEPPTITPRAAACLKDLDAAGLPGLLDRIVSAPHVQPPLPSTVPMMFQQTPELSGARGIARVELARMALAHAESRDADALRSFERALALARTAASRRILVSHLIGISIHALAYEELVQCLHDRAPSPETCRSYAALINRYPLPSPAHIIEGERIMSLDTLQYAYTMQGGGVGVVARKFGGILIATHAQANARAQRHFDDFAAIAALPVEQRLAAARKLDDKAIDLGRRYMLLEITLTSCASLFQYEQHLALRRDAARTLLAIAAFHHDNNRDPATLSELAPAYIPALPIDPFNRPKPLTYRPLPTPDSSNRTFLLYSLAFDSIDNQGLEAPLDEHRRERQPDGTYHSFTITALNTPGYDLVLNSVRQSSPPDEPDPTPADEPGARDPGADPSVSPY